MVESYSKICNYSTEYTLKSLGIVSSNVDLKINKVSGGTISMFIEEAFTHFNLFQGKVTRPPNVYGHLFF
jgi:hypothetical protein